MTDLDASQGDNWGVAGKVTWLEMTREGYLQLGLSGQESAHVTFSTRDNTAANLSILLVAIQQNLTVNLRGDVGRTSDRRPLSEIILWTPELK